ncbi:MAG: hypothetical protein R3212_04450, partial [Xanthomonadales bacterium]|nr:hypothetical protein [Xanthomonadales bacterium]
GSSEHWSELPVLRREGQALTRHVIDLLVRDSDGALNIVDYKTTAVDEQAGDAQQIREQQLDRYRTLVEALEIGPVRKTGLGILERG